MEQQFAAKTKRPPERVLHTQGSKTTEGINRRYHSNATRSPLLRLPAELRVRIWSLVLGGHIIHLIPGSKPRICQSDVGDFELATSLKANDNDEEPKRLDDYDTHHAQCFGDRDSAGCVSNINVQLLLVSRLVHSEAALIPFFATSSLRHLEVFTSCMIVEQSQSIRSLVLICTDLRRRADRLSDPSILEYLLGGVKKVAIMQEIIGAHAPDDYWSDFCTKKDIHCTTYLAPFKDIKIPEVTVAAYHTWAGEWDPFLEWSTVSKHELAEWEESVEKVFSDACNHGS